MFKVTPDSPCLTGDSGGAGPLSPALKRGCPVGSGTNSAAAAAAAAGDSAARSTLLDPSLQVRFAFAAGMLVTNCSKRFRRMFDDNMERVFGGSGVIIECEDDVDGSYAGVVLTYATLFVRTDDVQPQNVEVDVHLSHGKLCKGKVLACDFHYNLAAVRIVSDAPLQPAKLRELDDVISIDPNQQFSLRSNRLFQLRSHSNLFKILPRDKVLAIGRFFEDPHSPCIACGDFSVKRSPLDCKELYSVIGVSNEVYYGGPVINYSGEVIGIMLHESSFLPMNIVSRWWNNYKTSRKFGRPWIAVEVTNLHTARAAFL